MSLLVSPEKLNKLLLQKKRNLLVIDTRPFDKYLNGHIPSAVNIELMQYHWNDTTKRGIMQFESQLKKLISNIGISNDDFVVFYDDISGSSASRGIWLLHFFSHNNTAILDGGFNQWKEKNYEIEEITNPFLKNEFNPQTNIGILADYKYIKDKILNSKDLILIDSRSPEEYSGKIVRAKNKGHIKSAINIDWTLNISKNKFKNLKELKRIYKNIPRNSEIITYCQGGYRAANTYVVLKMLGYKKVKMYLGSWSEWGNLDKVPIEN
ncbi:MAG: sulfurtransferase [Nitrososphaeraceae archaeon]|nr:sulfurtransferase [Nitrososphaeraceae archaeon]